MTQKDFKVKNGIIAGGNITSSNGGFSFDATANTLSVGGSTVALASSVNTVQSNVTSILNNDTTFSGIKTFNSNVVVGNIIGTSGLLLDQQNAGGFLVLRANNHDYKISPSGAMELGGELIGGSYGANKLSLLNSTAILEGGIFGVQIRSSNDRVSYSTWTFGDDGILYLPGGLSANGSIGTSGQVLTSNANGIYWSTLPNADSVQSNLSSLTTSVNTIKANVDSVQSNVSTNTTRINTVQSNVSTLTTSVNTIAANVNSVQSNVGILTTSVNTIKANVDSVSSNVASIISGTTPFTGNITINRDLTVSGNLVVGGATSTILTTDTIIKDRVITLSNGASSASFDTGLYLNRGTSGNVFVGFDESTKQFVAAYTNDLAGNTVTDFSIAAYANVHFGSIVVEGLVDGVDIALLQSGVNTIKANVDSVQSNVATAVTNINTVQTNVTNLTTSVNTILSNVSSVQSNVSTLTTSVNTIAANVNSVQSNVTTLTTSVNTIAANVNSVQSNVTTLTTSVNTIKANVSSVQSNVSTLTTSVNTIKANVDSVQSNVTNITTGTTAFTGNISGPRVILNTQLQIGANTTTSVGATATTIFTFPGATYRGVDLTILVQDVTNSQYQLSKLMVVHNGTAVDWTEYAMLSTNNSDLTGFTAAIDGSSIVTIVSTGGSANKKITVSAQYIIQ